MTMTAELTRQTIRPYTVTEASEALGVSAKHVRRLIERGELPAMNQGLKDGASVWRISAEALDAFMARHAAD